MDGALGGGVEAAGAVALAVEVSVGLPSPLEGFWSDFDSEGLVGFEAAASAELLRGVGMGSGGAGDAATAGTCVDASLAVSEDNAGTVAGSTTAVDSVPKAGV